MVSLDLLAKLPFLKDTPLASLQRLSATMSDKHYKAGEVILKEGERSDALYILIEGNVRVEKVLDKKTERMKVVARLTRDEIFGEMSFLDHKPLSASVVADSDALVYVFHRQELEALSKNDSQAALDQVLTILSAISGRLRQTTTELVTVYEVARILVQDASLPTLVQAVLDQMKGVLGDKISFAFYRWNLFNDEYDIITAIKSNASITFPDQLDKRWTDENHAEFEIKPINFGKNREGMLVFPVKTAFDSGARQMIDTVSGLLAPSLATLRTREEEESRSRLERNRQENFNS